jgi:ABC-2 type transport system ATP-binding protein
VPVEAIRTWGLTKTYGKIVAVDHVEMHVPAAGVFGLLGPNGAGKTTIIKLLTGITDITEGEAEVAGFDVRRDPMHVKQNVGWVAAEVILDDDFTGWENLWLQAKLQRLSGWKERADALLKYFQLADRRKDKVSTYSTGMRKKLEIALALLHQPRVIFMDEPTIGLDPNTRRMLWELIRGVQREFGISVLLTTHYIEEADVLCDLVSIIDHGRFVASGTPSELKSRVKADIIDIETSEPVTEATWRATPGVLEARPQGKSWILKVQSAEEVLPRILGTLQNGSVRRINVEKPSLETVFLDVTGRRLGSEDGEVIDYRKFYAQMRRARQ